MPLCDECFDVSVSDLIVVPMSRIISHQPGLGTPDEVLGDGDGTDGGVGEKEAEGDGDGLGRDRRKKIP